MNHLSYDCLVHRLYAARGVCPSPLHIAELLVGLTNGYLTGVIMHVRCKESAPLSTP